MAEVRLPVNSDFRIAKFIVAETNYRVTAYL